MDEYADAGCQKTYILTNVKEQFDVAEALKEGTRIKLDLSNLPIDDGKDVFNFIGGVAYALQGQLNRESEHVFIFIPQYKITDKNIEVYEPFIKKLAKINTLCMTEAKMENNEEISELFEELIDETAPSNEKLPLMIYGEYLYKNNMLEAAQSFLEKYYKHCNDYNEINRKSYVRTLIYLSDIYDKAREYDKNEAIYKELLTLYGKGYGNDLMHSILPVYSNLAVI